jgi:hypothetical protein
VLAVEEIRKPINTPCQHLCNTGCGIYEARPPSCAQFECLWLQMSRGPAPLPKRLRPDRCGVMFVPVVESDNTIAAHCETPLALDANPVRATVQRWLRNGIRIIKIAGDKRTMLAAFKRTL